MRALIALLCGTLFGAGLAVSGMTDPMRVRAFLDLLGPWDPTLAFVMAGAIVPMAMAWRVQSRMARPFAAKPSTSPILAASIAGWRSAPFSSVWAGVSPACVRAPPWPISRSRLQQPRRSCSPCSRAWRCIA